RRAPAQGAGARCDHEHGACARRARRIRTAGHRKASWSAPVSCIRFNPPQGNSPARWPAHFISGYHFFTASSAHSGVLSVWQILQLLGISLPIETAGETNSNVWLRASHGTEFSPVLAI